MLSGCPAGKSFPRNADVYHSRPAAHQPCRLGSTFGPNHHTAGLRVVYCAVLHPRSMSVVHAHPQDHLRGKLCFRCVPCPGVPAICIKTMTPSSRSAAVFAMGVGCTLRTICWSTKIRRESVAANAPLAISAHGRCPAAASHQLLLRCASCRGGGLKYCEGAPALRWRALLPGARTPSVVPELVLFLPPYVAKHTTSLSSTTFAAARAAAASPRAWQWCRLSSSRLHGVLCSDLCPGQSHLRTMSIFGTLETIGFV